MSTIDIGSAQTGFRVDIEDSPVSGNTPIQIMVNDSTITEAEMQDIADRLVGSDYVTSRLTNTPAVIGILYHKMTEI